VEVVKCVKGLKLLLFLNCFEELVMAELFRVTCIEEKGVHWVKSDHVEIERKEFLCDWFDIPEGVDFDVVVFDRLSLSRVSAKVNRDDGGWYFKVRLNKIESCAYFDLPTYDDSEIEDEFSAKIVKAKLKLRSEVFIQIEY